MQDHPGRKHLGHKNVPQQHRYKHVAKYQLSAAAKSRAIRVSDAIIAFKRLEAEAAHETNQDRQP